MQPEFWLEWPLLQLYKPGNSRQSPVQIKMFLIWSMLYYVIYVQGKIKVLLLLSISPISTDKKWLFVWSPPSKDKIEEGGGIKAGLTQTSSSTTKVCQLLRCNPAIINEVHMLLSSQGSFKAGQIMRSLSHWQEITNDPTIIITVCKRDKDWVQTGRDTISN